MDIFKYAKEFNADYYDMHTGYTYLVQDYNKCKKLGLPTEGITVVCGGTVIGIVREESNN